MVVIKGPDATAGSIFILWKKIGTKVPTRLEINIAINSETPTHPDIAKEKVNSLHKGFYKTINLLYNIL